MPILAFFETSYDHEATAPLVDTLAEKSHYSAYSIWMVLLILAAEKTRPLYPDERFLAAVSGL